MARRFVAEQTFSVEGGSHVVHALVQLDREYTTAAPAEAWEDSYAARLVDLVE